MNANVTMILRFRLKQLSSLILQRVKLPLFFLSQFLVLQYLLGCKLVDVKLHLLSIRLLQKI